jgi:beta-glucosidase
MAKKKNSKPILGDDPFDGMELEEEPEEESIEILGEDPFGDMEWADLEQEDKLALSLHQITVERPLQASDFEPTPEEAEQEESEEKEAQLSYRDTGQPLFGRGESFTAPFDGFGVEGAMAGAEPAVTPEPLKLSTAEPEEPTLPEQPVEEAPAPQPVPAPTPETARPEATFYFPEDFKWGASVSSHQVEGHNTNNDWWAWEQEPGHIKRGHTSGQASDWWANAEEDFNRAAQIGLDAMRLSVEWSRIEPRPGTFDESALQRYAQMLQELHARNIEPMVTLHHFTNPMWLADLGGWENPETVDLFARFTRRVVEALGPYCDLWCTINEPDIYGYKGYVEGDFPPGKSDFKMAMRVIRTMLQGHAAAYEVIHELQPHARVGFAHSIRVFDPANPKSWLDRTVTRLADRAYNQAILTALTKGIWTPPLGLGLAWNLRHTLDWIGLNYYSRDLVAFDRARRQALFARTLHAEDAEMLDGGFGEFYPQGLYRSIRRLSRLNLPIYVTENGIPDADDDQRPRYLLAHIHQMWQAIQACYPVMGYYHWSLVDNFEWAEGWTLRFGLFEIDPKTQERTPRQSAELYTDLVHANAITPQVIERYIPQHRDELLPGCGLK